MTNMIHFDVFDPPMCCSSGVCGASVDPLLAAFAADLDWLTTQGVGVVRHNLSQAPQTFVAQPIVNDLLQREGVSCLPLVLLNGNVVGHGVYPRREELARLAGLTVTTSNAKPRIRLSGGGCKPGSGCC
jgi:hypothetical protein